MRHGMQRRRNRPPPRRLSALWTDAPETLAGIGSVLLVLALYVGLPLAVLRTLGLD
jgi:hypothetical protein